MEQKQLRVQKVSKLAYTGTTIIRIFLYVGIGILLAGLVFLAIGAESLAVLKFGNVTVDAVTPFTRGEGVTRETAILNVIEVMTLMAFLSMTLLYAGKLFKAVRDGATAFATGNVVLLKRAALFLILASAVPVAVCAIFSAILHVSYDGSMSLAMLVSALILYWLGVVFDYGADLQNQSDETL